MIVFAIKKIANLVESYNLVECRYNFVDLDMNQVEHGKTQLKHNSYFGWILVVVC